MVTVTLDPIKAYFSKAPAVVCTAGSYIAFMNTEAALLTEKLLFGKWLYDMMTPEDILRYEAHFENSKNGDRFSFYIRTIEDRCPATAVFSNIMGRRFATVIIFNSTLPLDAALLSCGGGAKPTAAETNEFLRQLLNVPDEHFGESDWGELCEMESMCATIVDTFHSFEGFSSLSYDSSRYRKSCISGVSTGGYLRMTSAMLYAVNEISFDRHLDISLAATPENAVLSVSTSVPASVSEICGVDGLCELFPAAGSFIDICRYVADVEGCELYGGIRSSDNKAFLSLSLAKLVSDTVDFRSRKSTEIYVQRLCFIVSLLDRIRS